MVEEEAGVWHGHEAGTGEGETALDVGGLEVGGQAACSGYVSMHSEVLCAGQSREEGRRLEQDPWGCSNEVCVSACVAEGILIARRAFNILEAAESSP